MGVNKLAAIMKVMSAKAGLKGRKTNHTARKTSVEGYAELNFRTLK